MIMTGMSITVMSLVLIKQKKLQRVLLLNGFQ